MIELLVAITIMAILAIMSWRGLDGMVRAQEQTRERADGLLVIQAALAQWGTDLDALQAIDQTEPLDWDGQVLRMTRRSSAEPDEGPVVVAWTRRNVNGIDQWLRWQSPPVRTRAQWRESWQRAAQWARTPGQAERRTETVLMPLVNWQVYYYRDGAWYNALSGSATNANVAQSQVPTAATNIPEGIRLQLTLPPGRALAGVLTRDWVNPVNGGGKS
ncbi:prepilin-type N-terminal cleavage/methylation domain-containing protein [Acidovorax sp. SUPP3334]|nr:prepilin-type N-terminal cleavage/methylation domain-containing protein [Acidovorax sp. SUPP3334]